MLEQASSAIELKRGATAMEGDGGSAGRLQWIQFELLWRDFFRLLTRRHAEVVLPRVRAAVTAHAASEPVLATA
jgi:hypothetical protein